MPRQQSKERNAEYKREWRKKNPIRARELSRINNKRRKRKGIKPKPLTEEQKARKLELWNIWKANNPERVRANDRNRRIRNKEKELIKYLKKRQIERAYKERRNEIFQKRKADGYYKTDAIRAKSREYYKNNREKCLLRKKRRYLAKKKLKAMMV